MKILMTTIILMTIGCARVDVDWPEDETGTDEACVRQSEFCTDCDGDGWCAQFDCDDHDSEVNPDMFEVPLNDLDDNCDGETDEQTKIWPEPEGGEVNK